MPALLIRLMINLAVPVLAYVLLRPHVHSDVTALVLGAAVPAAYSAGVLLWRRRLDAIGILAIVCFAIGLLLVVATGGNELVFKLREDIWTGTLGLACLISVAAGRPLFFAALRLAALRNAQIAERIGDPQARRVPTVATGVIGIILLGHAVVITALALTASTTTFLALKAPLSLVIVGGGVTALVFWIRRQHTGRRDRSPDMRVPDLQDQPGTTERAHQRKTTIPATTPARAAEQAVPGPMHRPGGKDHHAHRHDSQNGYHQRTDRRGVARGAG